MSYRSPLDVRDAEALARSFIAEAGASERVEASLDPRDGSLVITGRHGIGFFGTASFVPIRVGKTPTARSVAVAVARHVLEDPYSDERSVCARAGELPLALALLLGV